MRANAVKKIAFAVFLLISLSTFGIGVFLMSLHYDNASVPPLARKPTYPSEQALTEYQKCVVTAQYIFADSKPKKFEFVRNTCDKLPADDNDFQ